MKKIMIAMVSLMASISMSAGNGISENELAVRNLKRALEMTDSIFDRMYTTASQRLSFYYNMETEKASDVVSVWEYTSALEALNSVLEGLASVEESEPELYEEYYKKNVNRLKSVISGLDWYKGTYQLVSYTGRNTWSPYGVHRGSNRGSANVQGIENVYDDQMWIIRELIRAYRITGTLSYLTRAEELTRYVLDGWDCVRDSDGNEYGGITWGPGYTSKHACSNAPIISPLVWLYEIYTTVRADGNQSYKEFDDEGHIITVTKKKSEYYLDFAKKIYEWQRRVLRNSSNGVYYDGIWSKTGDITTYEVDGVTCRQHVDSNSSPQGTYHTYNTGTMLSGAADLYRATGDEYYLDELKNTSLRAYSFFTVTKRLDGSIYRSLLVEENRSTNPSKNGNPWFNQVLFRGFVAAAPYHNTVSSYLSSFQTALDYAYDNYLWHGFLPVDLLNGWGSNDTERCNVQYLMSRVAELGILVKYYGDLTGIQNVTAEKKNNGNSLTVYTVDGRKVRDHANAQEPLQGLGRGLYVVGGKKVAVQ
ncbi:MAG: hypothetical protein IJ196_01815 [Prevotella sp.]|nr:hypothetical protein [Prevotella sp.]